MPRLTLVVTSLLVHLVFSTKHREPLLTDDLRPNLYGYLASVGRDLGCEVFRVGGVADHVHLAVGLWPAQAIAELVQRIKQSTSRTNLSLVIFIEERLGKNSNQCWGKASPKPSS